VAPRPTITALRKAGTNSVAGERHGTPWRRLPVAVVLACELQPGLELDRTRLRRLRAELRHCEALATAGRLLRHRDLAAERLESELARRQIAPAARREALGVLGRAGALDDSRLAAQRASALAERGYGDEAIRWRLVQAGLGEDRIDEALGALDSEPERARAVVEREGLSARTARLLVRRGFGQDAVETACPFVAEGGESALG
jgi:SOS response regulatory protein OraA/RecX